MGEEEVVFSEWAKLTRPAVDSASGLDYRGTEARISNNSGRALPRIQQDCYRSQVW